MEIHNALQNGLKYLTNFNQFVAWIGIPQANGKVKKLLINPHTGRNASSTNESTWGSYADVVAFCEQNTEYNIGFVFSETDDLFFFDIDDAREPDGSWNDWAKYLISMFPGAFVEESQSRKGLHIIGRGTKPEGYRCKHDGNWDVYVSKRFAALTGFSAVGDAGAYDHTASLQTITIEQLEPETQHAVNWSDCPVDGYTFNGTDDELLAVLLKSRSMKAAFNGAASFKDIWTRNEAALLQHFPSDQGDGMDESRVDSALCSHLAWATGKNPQRIENIVSNWEYVREKWLKRGKYREDTILKACAIASDQVYSMVDKRVTEFAQALPKANTESVNNGLPVWTNGVMPGGEYGKDHTPNAIEYLRTFYDNGNYLKRVDQDFYRYDGKVWNVVADETIEAEINTAMLHVSPQASWVDGTLKQVKRICTTTLQLGEWKGRDTRNTIVYQNGIIDLKENEFLPHTPQYMTTNIMPYEYDNTATCPNWDNFVSQVFEGDQERVMLLQEWLGYLLVNDYSFHKAMLLIGKSRSGKGTIGRIIRLLVGDQNYSAVGLEDLADDSNLDALRTKTVGFDGDAHSVSNTTRGVVLTRFKKITGADTVQFRRKYKSSMSEALPTRFTIAANNLLNFNDDSGALTGRLLILPFNISWEGREDLTLDDKLSDEIQGIANWAIQGLFRLRQNMRFTKPAISDEEVQSLQETYSPLRMFADTCLVFGNEHSITGRQLFAAYQMWCKSEGRSSGTQSALTQHMKNTFRGEIKHTVVTDELQKQARGFRGVGIAIMGNVVPFQPKAS